VKRENKQENKKEEGTGGVVEAGIGFDLLHEGLEVLLLGRAHLLLDGLHLALDARHVLQTQAVHLLRCCVSTHRRTRHTPHSKHSNMSGGRSNRRAAQRDAPVRGSEVKKWMVRS
jgi:hypothetical protein